MACYWGFIVGDGCLVLLRGRLVEIVLFLGWDWRKALSYKELTLRLPGGRGLRYCCILQISGICRSVDGDCPVLSIVICKLLLGND